MKLYILLIFLSLLLTSCINSRDSNPELSDLIYKDIKKDIQMIDRVVKLRKTEIEIVKGERDLLPIRSPDRLPKNERIKNMSADVDRFLQLSKYLKIKLKKRAVYSRILYELSLKENKEWPDQNEYKKYLLAKSNGILPVKEINKADNSRQLTHKKDIGKILKDNKVFE